MSSKISVSAKKFAIVRSGLVRTILAVALCAAPTAGLYAANTINGGKLYGQYCVGCHGPSGQGVMPGTPNFSRGDALLQPDNALLTVIKNGKNAMPGFQGAISDHDILDVIAYLRTLMH